MRAALLLVVIMLAACAQATSPSELPPLHPAIDDLPEAVIHLAGPDDGEEVQVDVKIAGTPKATSRGLMEVPELPDGIGMLFTYERERTGAFWMKNTLIPLDIGFFDADGRLRVILQMEPCEEDPCPTYDPGIAYTDALEVRAGWFDDRGVEPGWSLVRRP